MKRWKVDKRDEDGRKTMNSDELVIGKEQKEETTAQGGERQDVID